jgi:hypothetical protein
MSTMTRSDAWDTDQTLLCERLAERLRNRGSAHPVAAAVALAVRGAQGLDQRTFADRSGLDLDELRRIDDGQVALEDLPAPILLAARHAVGLDLDHLASLDADQP